MTVPRDAYDFFIDPIRSMDQKEGRQFLERWMRGIQEVWESIDLRTEKVADLWSITDCPDEYLIYLKWIVGWTTELEEITRDLTADELRRLISISTTLWKTRGPEPSIIDVLFFATAARARIWNWFDFRWVTGETGFFEDHGHGDPWLIPLPNLESPTFDERHQYLSNLRIVDDGTLNRTLTLNLLRLMRATHERWEVTYLAFLDLFTKDTDDTQWTKDQAESLIVEDGEMVLGSDTGEEITFSIRDLAIGEGVFSARVKFGIYEGELGFFINRSDDPDGFLYYFGFNTEFRDEWETHPAYAYLIRYVDGDWAPLYDLDLLDLPIFPDVYYTYRMTIAHEVDGRIRLKLFIDGNEVMDVIDDQFVPEPAPPENVIWVEERPIDDDDYAWYGAAIGGDAAPVILAWIDGAGVWKGTLSGGVITWVEVFPAGPSYAGYWYGGAVGYDGQTMVMVEVGGVPYLSDDGGATWDLTDWVSPASDWFFGIGGDNLTVIRAAWGASVWVSDDLGETWGEKEIDGYYSNSWSGCAAGRDPLVMAVCADMGRAYLTIDGWATFTELQPHGDADVEWSGVAIGGDNQTILLAVFDGPIFYSPDRGASWKIVETGVSEIYGVAIGADSKLAFTSVYYGRVWRTDDVTIGPDFDGLPIGQNGWGGLGPYETQSLLAAYTGIAISYDGAVVIACAYPRLSRISSDGGSTWRDETDGGDSTDIRIAVGADNQKLFRVKNAGDCAVSYDQGSSWSAVQVGGVWSGSWLACAVGRDPEVMAACLAWTGAWMTIDDWATSIELDPPDLSANWGGVAIGGDDQTVVLISISTGRLFITPNRGTDWSEITLPPDAWPSSVAISQDCTTIYLGSGDRLWSKTGSADWVELRPLGDVDAEYSGIGVGGDDGDQILVCSTSSEGALINPALPPDTRGTYTWTEVTTPFTGGGGG